MAIDTTTRAEVGWNITAYNLAVDYALWPQMHFDAVADVSPMAVDHPGTTITFRQMVDLSNGTTALTETDDVTPEDMSSGTVTVTLAEYGNAVRMSPVLTGAGYILPFDPIAAELIGRNAAISLDSLARDVVQGKTGTERTNRKWASPTSTENANNQVDTADVFTGAFARFLTAKLRGANVTPNSGNAYTGYIHPDVSYDFQQDSGTGNWSAAYSSSDTLDPLQLSSIGVFGGVNWVETPRCRTIADAGDGLGSTGTIDVYFTTVTGRQAVSKAFSQSKSGPQPNIRAIPVTDVLSRFSGVGWYWFGGYGAYREAAMYQAITASSIGTNA